MSQSPLDERCVETELAHIDSDEGYRVLANEDRRLVLDVLEDTPSLSLEELTEQLTEKKQDASHRQVKITLVHQHLPILSNAGVLEFDRETHRIDSSKPALESLLRLL